MGRFLYLRSIWIFFPDFICHPHHPGPCVDRLSVGLGPVSGAGFRPVLLHTLCRQYAEKPVLLSKGFSVIMEDKSPIETRNCVMAETVGYLKIIQEL